MYLKYLNFAWKIEEVFKYVDHPGFFSNVFTLSKSMRNKMNSISISNTLILSVGFWR